MQCGEKEKGKLRLGNKVMGEEYRKGHHEPTLWGKSRDICYYCDCALTFDGTRMRTIDHIRAQCRRGTNDNTNKVYACAKCNGWKGPRSLNTWRKRVQESNDPEAAKIVDNIDLLLELMALYQ